jgi:hypothetical protein
MTRVAAHTRGGAKAKGQREQCGTDGFIIINIIAAQSERVHRKDARASDERRRITVTTITSLSTSTTAWWGEHALRRTPRSSLHVIIIIIIMIPFSSEKWAPHLVLLVVLRPVVGASGVVSLALEAAPAAAAASAALVVLVLVADLVQIELEILFVASSAAVVALILPSFGLLLAITASACIAQISVQQVVLIVLPPTATQSIESK